MSTKQTDTASEEIAFLREQVRLQAELAPLRTRLDCEAATGTYHCRVETPCRACALRRLQAAEAALAQLREALALFRQLLWVNHGCPLPALYGDDGEMQCHCCGIDFKRLEPSQIRDVWQRRNLAALAGREEAADVPSV